MAHISEVIKTIVMIGVVNMCITHASPSTKGEVISPVTAQFIPDVMPGMENPRWPPGGHYLIVVRNTGKTPMEIKDIFLNGVSVVKGLKVKGDLKFTSIWHGEDQSNPSEPTQKLASAGEPIWYKITPTSIPVGGLGFVLMKARSVPVQPIEVSITDDWGDVYTALVTPEEPKTRLAYVGFGTNCDQMVIFIRKLTPETLTLDRVYLDEVDITAQCRMVSPDFWKDLGVLTVSLAKPLKEGSCHLLRLTTKQDVQTVDIVRAKKDFFPVGIYGWSSKGATAIERMYDFYRSLKAHHFNSDLLFIWPKDSAMRNSPEGRELARRNDIMLLDADDKHWYVRDEIDIWEGVHLKSLPESKRLGCMAQTDVIEFMKDKLRKDVAALGWLQLDGWGHPANYFIHARAADIPSSGDYAGQGAKQPIAVYDAVNALRWASMPGPFNTLIYAAWEKSIGVPRFPTSEEEKIMAYYCLASGGKGLCYYTYDDSEPGGTGDHGVEANPTLLKAIGRINQTVQTITPLLLQAYPVEGVVSQCSVEAAINPDKLWIRTLLCTDGKLILILVNHDFTSDVNGFASTPLKDVEITLESPPWTRFEQAVRMDGDGVSKVEFLATENAGAMTLRLPEVKLAELIVLGSSDISTDLGRRFGELQSVADQRVTQLTAALEAEREELSRKRAKLKNQGILLESGCEIGDGRDLADWREEGPWPRSSQPDSSEKRSGGYSLRVIERKQYSLPVGISAGITCRLEFYVKFSKIAPDESVQAGIEYLDAEGDVLDTTSIIETAAMTDWHFASCEGVAPSGTSQVRIMFQQKGTATTAWVDDVRLLDESN